MTLVYFKMSFNNVRSIFDVFKIIKIFLRVPDLTITTSNTAETNYKDYFRFILFQLYLLYFLYTYYIDKSIFLSTGSHILNAGLALLLVFGTLFAFIVRMEFFIKRYCVWEIILKLNEFDQHVRMSFIDSLLMLFQLQLLPISYSTVNKVGNQNKLQKTYIVYCFFYFTFLFLYIYLCDCTLYFISGCKVSVIFFTIFNYDFVFDGTFATSFHGINYFSTIGLVITMFSVNLNQFI